MLLIFKKEFFMPILSVITFSFGGAVFYDNPDRFIKFGFFCGFNGVLYKFIDWIIPTVKELTLKANLKGRDINKDSYEPVPESLGLASGLGYQIFNTLQLLYGKWTQNHEFQVLQTAAILSISFCVFLGFCDDVLDLRWKYKIILPIIASLPLLINYTGSTDIRLPNFLWGYFGSIIDIGFQYYIYMSMLSIFCMNSINIYAGINGLEVGQSIIIGFFVLIHNQIELRNHPHDEKIVFYHSISLILILTFITSSAALFKWNKYPSKVFVGDTYCYFAGMVFATAGILGHFTKTLLLFFLPQLINFVLSIPQQAGTVYCPRHRLATYNKPEDKQKTTYPQVITKLDYVLIFVYSVLDRFPRHSLAKKHLSKPLLDKEIKNNLNQLNFALHVQGETSERDLCDYLMFFQIICCIFGLFLKYCVFEVFC